MRFGVDHAFEHDLGMGWHRNAIFGRAHHFKRLAKQAAGHMALVHTERQPCRSSQHEQRVRTDHHGNPQRLTLVRRRLQNAPQMPARMQAGRQLVARMNHRAVIRQIACTRYRAVASAVARKIGGDDAVGNVRRAVGLKMFEQRQCGQINVVSLYNITHRPTRQHPRIDQLARARLIRGVNAGRIRAKHARHPLARAEQIGDHLAPDATHLIAHQQRVLPACRK